MKDQKKSIVEKLDRGSGWSSIRFFQPEEFDSPDAPGSGHSHMNLQFVRKLDRVREIAGFGFVITSGYRTFAHNDSVGGVGDSSHTKGVAADIAIGTNRQRFQALHAAILVGFHRIGIGANFLHLDDDKSKPAEVAWLA